MNNRYKNNSKFGFINAVVDCTGLIKGALTTDEKSILLTIWSYLDNETNKSWLTRQQIIDLSGFTCDSSKFRKAYQSVQDKGWLIVERQFNNSNIYTLQVPQDILNVLESHDCIHEPIVQDVRKPTNKKCTFKKYPSVQDVQEGTVQVVQEASVQDVQSKRKVKENIKENILIEKKEKECKDVTNVPSSNTLKENASIEATIQNNKSIFNCDEEEPIFNYNTNTYENITDDNEQSYLSETELIERHGTDKEHINSNPYVKKYIIDTILDIIEYNKDQKHQDNLSKWIDNHNDNDFIYYIYRLVTEPQYKKEYDWIAVKQDKVKRLATIKSRLYADYQTFYNNNNQDEIEYIDESEVPEWIKYLRDYD